METIFDFGRTMSAMRVAKQYNEALAFFKANKADFHADEIGANEFITSEVLTCLRKTKAFDAAFQFMKFYSINADETMPERLLTAYAWVLYDNYKALNNISENDLHEQSIFEEPLRSAQQKVELHTENTLLTHIAQVLVLLQKRNSSFTTNVLEFLFKITIRNEKKKFHPSWQVIISLCDSVNADTLSTDCTTIQVKQKGEMKDMELASAHEEWYAAITKALFETKQYERCFELSKLGLEAIEKFHYSNNLWLARRMALCKKELDDIDQAIAELEKILRKRREWFILKELASFYTEKKETEKSLRYACEAMTAYGPLEFKVELIEMLGDMLVEKGEWLMAYQHFMLEKLIREQEKWQVPKRLTDKLKACNRQQNNQPVDLNTLKKELKPFWLLGSEQKVKTPYKVNGNEVNTKNQKQTGIVSKLLPKKEAGVDGFIKLENGKTVYFFLRANNDLYEKVAMGMRLEFETIASNNGKGDKAIKIKMI